MALEKYTLIDFIKDGGYSELQESLIFYYAMNPIMEVLPFANTPEKTVKWNTYRDVATGTFRALNSGVSASHTVLQQHQVNLAIMSAKFEIDIQYANDVDAVAREMRRQTEMNGWSFTRYFFQGNQEINPVEFNGISVLASKFENVTKLATNGIAIDDTAANARSFFSAIDYLISRTAAPVSELVMFCGIDVLSTMKTAASLANNAMVFQYQPNNFNNMIEYYNGVRIVGIPTDPNNSTILGFNETCGTGATCASVYICHLSSDVGLHGVKQGNFTFTEETQHPFRRMVMEVPMAVIGLQQKCIQKLAGVMRTTNWTSGK